MFGEKKKTIAPPPLGSERPKKKKKEKKKKKKKNQQKEADGGETPEKKLLGGGGGGVGGFLRWWEGLSGAFDGRSCLMKGDDGERTKKNHPSCGSSRLSSGRGCAIPGGEFDFRQEGEGKDGSEGRKSLLKPLSVLVEEGKRSVYRSLSRSVPRGQGKKGRGGGKVQGAGNL